MGGQSGMGSRINAMFAGRVFKCEITGEKFTIPIDVSPCDYYSFGESFIDVGRDDSYYRTGGKVVEIVEERNVQEYPFLPHWAIGRAFGEFVLGAQLATRDGRRVGNGHIIEISVLRDTHSTEIFTYLSDAGNQLRLTKGQLEQLFYHPVWVSDVEEVKRKFMREDDGK